MTVVAIVIGCILYYFSVRPEMQFTTTSYLVGYGFILPFWLAFPVTASRLLGVHNKIVRFTMTTCVTSICSFRTTAAIHGFSPQHTTTSMKRFVFYYSAPILAKYNSKTKKYVGTNHVIRTMAFAKFYGWILLAGMMASAFELFPEYLPALAKEPTTVWYDWKLIFNLNNLKNNLLYAAFFQIYLTTFTQAMSALQMAVTLVETENVMNNPVFGATSPSNFWGRRWNLLIHDVLKRGVFLPVRRQFGSNTAALVATFAASGLFHEWLQLTLFPTWDHEVSDDGTCRLLKGLPDDSAVTILHCYSPQWGASMAFFLWQAMLIAIEFAVGPYCKGFFLGVPAPVKTILTVVAGGCVAHWFTEPYVHSNFFLDGNAALFYLKRA